MSEVLLVEMDFNGKTWYLSEEGYYSDHYYAPYLAESPSLELGQIKGGYIGVRIGDLSIANRPNERFSPFSIFAGGYDVLVKNPNQKIPIRISWEKVESTELIFEGLMYLKQFDVDKFEFILEDDYSDQDLLTTASDITSELEEITTVSIKGNLTYAVVTSPEHGLSTGDKVSVTNAINTEFNTPFQGSFPQKVDITKIDDNTFSYPITIQTTAYEPSGSYVVRILTKKNNPFSFGVVTREKGLIQTEDGTGTSIGFAYANPQLEVGNATNPISLFDDGVLHGTETYSTGTYRTISIIGVTYDVDIVTVTTSVNHGMIPGNSIAVFGLTPDIINSSDTGDIVLETPTLNTFTYYKNNINEEPATTGTSYLWVFGEYFGIDRLPTATTIFSRAARNDVTVSGTTNLPYPDDPNFSGTPTIVTTEDGLSLVGTALVSGISTNGSTLADFFSFLREKLGISSVDFSKAPDASSINLQLWETTQTKLIDFAGEVSYAANHLFEIKNDQIRVIDRSITPDTFKVINNYDVIKTKYTMPNPVKAIIAKWKINQVNATVKPAQLTEYDESVMISNSASGEIREVFNITKNIEQQRSMLFKIRDIINKIVISMQVGGIRSDLFIGDRIKVNRDEDGLSLDFIIRTISYNFSDLSTDITGDGTVRVIEQDAVY